jgi:hypothetical protein
LIRLLDENPEWAEALRARLLTRELLELPAVLARFIQETNERFDRVERRLDHLEADVAELKTDVAELKTDVAGLKTDVGYLKGSDLETQVHRRIRPLLSQRLQLRRARIVLSGQPQAEAEFEEAIADAAEAGRISSRQEQRIIATDVILHAQRSRERTPVWIAVEVANRIDADDIRRSRESADTLAAVFGEEAVPVVAGYRIDAADLDRAAAEDVRYLEVSERF